MPNDSARYIGTQCDSFDPCIRREALLTLLKANQPFENQTDTPRINLHLHSFFSYNARGWSPTHLAWESARLGLYASGLCDFDVLDGLDEFLDAGRLLGMRVAVSVENRVFLPEYADAEINSPGEPGVAYIMACGFARCPTKESRPGAALLAFRQQADQRNRELTTRINARLNEINIDYDRDVAPLSPGRCPTERHLVRAFRDKAKTMLGANAAAFWSKILGKDEPTVCALEQNIPGFEELIRAKLVKKGGLGYLTPTPSTFPPVAEFTKFAVAAGAIPTITWLDGLSKGESDMPAMCDCLMAHGAAAINLIPERNHNISDPAQRAIKIANLEKVVLAARARHLPVFIGTEMNKDGQPFFDDLSSKALSPYTADFLAGARILTGQTILARYADFPYIGHAAKKEFCDDLIRKNKTFEAVGRLPGLTVGQCAKLEDMGCSRAFSAINDSAKQGQWNF